MKINRLSVMLFICFILAAIMILLISLEQAKAVQALNQRVDRYEEISASLLDSLHTTDVDVDDDSTSELLMHYNVLPQEAMDQVRFSQLMEQLITEQQLEISSFSPEVGDVAQVFEDDNVRVYRSPRIQVRLKGYTANLFSLLSAMRMQFPWIQISRFQYQADSTVSGRYGQADMISYYMYSPTLPDSQSGIHTSASLPPNVVQQSRAIAQLFKPYYPQQSPSVLQMQQSSTLERQQRLSTPQAQEETGEVQFLGIIEAGEKRMFSLKFIQSDTVEVLSIGDVFHGWTLTGYDEQYIYLSYEGKRWLVRRNY